MANVRYIKILTLLRGLRDKIANFHELRCLRFPEERIKPKERKKTEPNIERWPSLRVMLEF